MLRLVAVLALAAVASCSKLSSSRIWVKRPGSKRLEIISSLSTLCAEQGLDEEAMLAVARGEADDYEGWECGEADCEESDEAAADGADVVSEAAEGADDTDDTAEPADEAEAKDAAPATDATPPAPAFGSKMIVGLIAPMAGTQLMKRFDEKSPNFLLGLRGCFTACVAVHTAVDMLLQAKIRLANETELVKAAPNPLSMLMGGGLGAAAQTAREYDLSQLGQMRNSFRMGVVVVALMHWKFKFNQVLVYQGIQTLIELFYHPLVQIHLLGRAATGALGRPFGSGQGQPDMAALFKGLAGPAPAEPAPAS